MKKLMLVMAVALFSFGATAQNFNAGISGGIPTGDFSDFYSFALSIDVEALWEAGDNFDAGIATGFSSSFLDSEFDGDNASFIPIAAAGRFGISDEFSLGADIGYALGVNEGNDGGFYYAPKAMYGISDAIDIVLSYRGFNNDGDTLSNISLGVMFGL
ncbi:outer membrane beta-barrel protein [Pontimicrobium aquaticum]|uniref:Outer membrane protein beta-barrel domain-containing protein n=1 Tax=Pontimicrobium aquaticum TaxID=2565367 RepID=A0A4V5LQ97_9FLAO|nr:outer membrane beta-barrel protein [Pontimicrobium aquaticum]TJY34049.1 hypothetical protein E5167_12080 [Pontimicrobium aquaticum]